MVTGKESSFKTTHLKLEWQDKILKATLAFSNNKKKYSKISKEATSIGETYPKSFHKY